MMRALTWSVLLVCGMALGQSYPIKTIVFEGAPQYTPADLLTMSGLKATGTMTKAEMEDGVNKLDASGLFSDVHYQTAGPVLHIVLVPMAGAGVGRTVNYVNFVMFTPEELDAKVRARVPLYRGTIPVNGSMQEDVARALEAVLAERGIAGSKVMSIAAMGGGVLNYSIEQPAVVVKAVELGVDLGTVPELAAVQARYVGQEYREGQTGAALVLNLTDAYHDLGYVDFSMGPVTHGPPALGSDRIGVTLVGTAKPGPLYHVSRVDLPVGVAGVSVGDLERRVDLKAGGVASRIEVLSAQARINAAFEARGYLDAKTVVTPSKDAAAHTMAYAFATEPGAVYHLAGFSSGGLPPDQFQVLQKGFPIARGEVFEPGKVMQFSLSGAAKTMCGGKPVKLPYKADKASHTVDVTAMCR